MERRLPPLSECRLQPMHYSGLTDRRCTQFFSIRPFNALYLFILVVIMSLLLAAELPMFSLKFKDLSWGHNKISYIFLIVSILLRIIFQLSGFAAVIVWYIILSLLTYKK